MKKVFPNFKAAVSLKYRDEFFKEINKENLFRLTIASLIVTVSEVTIYLFCNDSLMNTEEVMLGFIFSNFIFLPLLYLCYRRVNTFHSTLVRLVQYVYIWAFLLFGLHLALIPQNEFASIHVYILVVFGIAAFVHLTPLESVLMFFPVYVLYYFLLPYYQYNREVLPIFQVNAFILNFIACIFSAMVMRMRVITFIDKKVIMNRNVQLKELARRDSMTSLLNYEHLYKKLNEEIGRAKLYGSPLSVIMIDIDDFKQINDTFGHLTGDKIIIQVARVLIETCRSSDIIGRYGGEEFIIILPQTGLNEAKILAERIRSTLEHAKFEMGCTVTISGGIMEYHGETAEELIMGADKSQYTSKETGKNRITVFQ